MNEFPKGTDDPLFDKQRKSFFVLGMMIACGLMGILLWFGAKNLPILQNLIIIPTSSPTMIFTPPGTSTATVTPRPTSTYPPLPTRTGTVTLIATPDKRVLNSSNQHLYLYVQERKTWSDARDYCALRGGHLVSIQAPSENKFVYNLAVPFNVDVGTWLGGTDEEKEGTWTWVTGETWNYHSWRRNNVETEPDNAPNGADYLTFDYWDTTWHDESGGERYFVCEWEP